MNRDPKLQRIVDELAGALFDYTLSRAHEEKVCVDCHKSVLVWSNVDPIGPDWAFRDDLSLREYRISGLCQECQDSVFTEPEEEEDDEAYLCPDCGAQEGEPHRFMCPGHTEGV